ncbi:hypothetical protein TSAR_012151 [Trichomalopsis sarcophagae]|uniref:Glycogen [starch] synthase n=1 Tax=Trichomalopsis sarcophagae TaxID=543379 RepID=A0A232FL68_9HYME|nr:hypothetical protein TSAR_012151 [Trichomalopsis sarcophagae]
MKHNKCRSYVNRVIKTGPVKVLEEVSEKHKHIREDEHITKLEKKVITGTWLVDGNPQIILFDIGSAAWKLDEYKQELWNCCNFGIPHLDVEANDAIILGYLVCQFISEFRLLLIDNNVFNARWYLRSIEPLLPN